MQLVTTFYTPLASFSSVPPRRMAAARKQSGAAEPVVAKAKSSVCQVRSQNSQIADCEDSPISAMEGRQCSNSKTFLYYSPLIKHATTLCV